MVIRYSEIKNHFGNNHILYLSCLIFILFFFITRLPFFLAGATVDIRPDYLHYYTIVDQINKGIFPAFTIRTPGYPLFLSFIFLFFKSNLAVAVAQNLLSFLAPLFFIFVIYTISKTTFRFLPLLAATGLAAFVSSATQQSMDSTLLTDSLYTNCIIVFFGFLFLGEYSKKKWHWILCGLSMAAIMITRPSGLFFILFFFLILFFLWLNKVKKQIIVLFSIAFVSPLFFMCTYNLFTIGSFSLTTFTEHALISFTSSFLEPDPGYPPGVDKAIERSQIRMKNSRKKILEKSWDHRKLARILQKTYNHNRVVIFKTLKSFEKETEDNLYMKWRPMLRRISLDAIKKHPIFYLKYVYANLVHYFFKRRNPNFDSEMRSRNRKRWKLKKSYEKNFQQNIKDMMRLYYKNTYIKTLEPQFLKNLLKEYWDLQSQPKEQKINFREKEKKPTFLQNTNKIFNRMHGFIFVNNLWIYFFFFAFAFSLVRTFITHFHHQGTFLFFLLTLGALLHGVVISMSSIPNSRLATPLDFIYYLSLFLFPIMWIPKSEKSEKKEK